MAVLARPRSAVAFGSGQTTSVRRSSRPASQGSAEGRNDRDRHLRTVSVKPTSAAVAVLAAVADAGPTGGLGQALWAFNSVPCGTPLSKCASAPTIAARKPSLTRTSSKFSQDFFRASSKSSMDLMAVASSKHAAEMHNALADQLAIRKFEKMRDELCEGLRVLILGQRAPPLVMNARAKGQTSPPPHHKHPANAEQSIKIYKFFWTLLRKMTKVYELKQESSDDEDYRASETTPLLGRSYSQLRFDTRVSSLPQVKWSNILAWVALEAQMSTDASHKSVSLAFLRALKAWKHDHASPNLRSSGVSLLMLLRWTWPHANNFDIANMLCWICFHELEKISFPEPKVIDVSERRRLIDLFQAMDSSKSGFCSSEDVAGGERPDQTRNIVDTQIVQAVCGKGMDVITFLEMMCEEGYRGHDAALRVFLKDGRRLVHYSMRTIGFDGWVLDEEDVTSEDAATRKVIESLEAEIRFLRRS